MASRPTAGLTARQVDVWLEVLVIVAVATGALSFLVGTGWVRWITAVHGVAGLSLLVLAPAKIRGSVRTGLRRRRPSRWLSVGFGLLVVATIALGFLHSTGLWYGIGYWSALWTHVLFAAGVAALFVWHLATRPARPTVADMGRRALLRGGGAVALGAAVYGAQEVVVRAAGWAGGSRRFTGSHEVASFDPVAMPTVSWIDDEVPASTAPERWRLEVAGQPIDLAELVTRARPRRAALDCTGGWWSEQAWDCVPLADLLGTRSGRSIKVTSSTGYSRLFPFSDRHRLFLAVGYGGEPLRPGHGAPVRLVAPGRRGPWWVKWVTSVQPDRRPWWLQVPLPLE